MPFRVGLIALALFIATGSSPAASQEEPRPVGTMAPIVVDGEVFTLREVIQAAMRGERTKLAGHVSSTHVLSVRNTLLWSDKKEIYDQVYRVYQDSTGYRRRVFVRAEASKFKQQDGEWIVDKDPNPEQPDIRIGEFENSDFTRLPLYLREDGEFDFKLLDRILDATHVVFRIEFHPRSQFSALPSGEIYIDSDGFKVMHEIYNFPTNPAPLFIKGIRRASRQWTHLATGEWVPLRIAFELDVRDSFGLAPNSVSAVASYSDYTFDQPYDAHLFGESDRDPLPPSNYKVPPPDSLRYSSLLARLHAYDDDEFTLGIEPVDTTFTRSTLAWHDSLGIQGLPTDDIALTGSDWQFGLSPAITRWDYNRVEGMVLGGEVTFAQADDDGSSASVFVAYATASEDIRSAIELKWRLPLGGPPTWLALESHTRAEPFGSNRPALNSLRALVGGADDQDYLESKGYSARLITRFREGMQLALGYSSMDEKPLEPKADFSFFGDLYQPNLAANMVGDNVLMVEFTWDAGSWLQLALAHRHSVGWDLLNEQLYQAVDYGRTDARIGLRGFPLGQEFRLGIAGASTYDHPAVQQQCDIGGLSTIRGYDRRARVGDHSLALRGEYLVPYDILMETNIPVLRSLHLQFVPWADMGRVWSRYEKEDWISSAGLGIQRYLGPFGEGSILRFDMAFPLEPGTPDAVYYLRFESVW